MNTTPATQTHTRLRGHALPVYRANMAASWRSLLFWSALMLTSVMVILPLYPTLTSPSWLAAINRLPRLLYGTLRFDQIHTGPGYTQALIFALVGYLVIVAAAIQWGSAATVGTEDNNSLHAVPTRGIGPARYCLEASAAVLTRLSIIALATYLAIRWLNKPLEIELKVRLLRQTTIVWLGLGALVAASVILVGAYVGNKVWARAAGVLIAVTSYIVDAIARLNPDWHWIADLSPVDWAFGDNPLWKGLDGWGEISLWVLSLALIVLAVLVSRHGEEGT